jgi:hypothetical protein
MLAVAGKLEHTVAGKVEEGTALGPLSHAHDLQAVKAKKTPHGPTHMHGACYQEIGKTSMPLNHQRSCMAPTCMPFNLTFSLMQ